jgi:uncharacterized protein YdaU (DUF1376 family)
VAKHPPAFQFYASDFYSGTAEMTTAEVGGYILLLCHQWDRGSVPGDSLKKLAQIMRCSPATTRSVWTAISAKFPKGEDGEYRNARLERARSSQLAYRLEQGNRGRASAEAKANRKSTSVAPSPQPTYQPEVNSPVSSLQSSVFKRAEEEPAAAARQTRPTLQGRGAYDANSLQRDHLRHVICGPEFRFCLSDRVYGILAPIFNDAPDVTKREITRWVAEMEATTLAPGKSAGDIKWLLNHFNAWVTSLGRVPDAPATAAASSRLAAIDRWGT